jgi:hypothetical protein
MKMGTYIGIDPGQSGAIAVINRDGYTVDDWPGDEVAAADLILTIKHNAPGCGGIVAALESVHAMPRQGVSSTFKFGCNFGIWRGILAMAGIPFRLVRPQEWQRGVITKADGKTSSLAAARRLFPAASMDRVRDHGRADALLIADWLRRQ